MNATTVAVDLAKVRLPARRGRCVLASHRNPRLTRTQFERWFANRDVPLVIMEACGSAHHWARWLNGLGIEVRLLPAQYVRAYVKRNKTDAADAAACSKPARASDMRPVRVKSVEQQALQGMHRIRSLWMGTRTSASTPCAASAGSSASPSPWERAPASKRSAGFWPTRHRSARLIRGTAKLLMEEIRLLEARIAQLERELASLARLSPACTTCCRSPASGCSRPPPWWRPPRGCQPLQGCQALCQLVWADAQGVQLGQQPLPGAYLQEGRPLPAHVAHPRRPQCAARGQGGRGRGQTVCGVRRWALRCKAAAITTRRPVRWPTSWRASVTPRCATRSRLVNKPCGLARRSRESFVMPA
jgi:transposase